VKNRRLKAIEIHKGLLLTSDAQEPDKKNRLEGGLFQLLQNAR